MEKLQFLWFICEVFQIVKNLPPTHTIFQHILEKNLCKSGLSVQIHIIQRSTALGF